MSLAEEETLNELISEFARISGVDDKDVEAKPEANGKSLTLVTHNELKNEARDYELIISSGDTPKKWLLTGSITVTPTGGQEQKKPVNETLNCPLKFLPKAVGRVLDKYKAKRGFLDNYFG